MKKFLLFTTSCLLFTFVIALPIGIYFIKNPQDFIGRATPISIFAAENPLIEFGKSLILHLGMFNIYGDSNWRHNYATSPELFWPIGILFLIGVILSFREIFRKSNTRAAAKSKRRASFPLSLSRGESSVAEEEDLSSLTKGGGKFSKKPLLLFCFINYPSRSEGCIIQ